MTHKRSTAALTAAGLVWAAGPAWAHGMNAEHQKLAIHGGYFDYFWLGAQHMLTGYDHLLFLFGVMFFLTRFGDILKFITAFTLGHCLTLVFATLKGVKADYHLVDAVIALTVCYKGFENLDGFRRWVGFRAPNLLAMVFVFGLIHGFGLSTRLQQLPIWESQGRLIVKILSFNVGVEAGQVMALAVMMLLLSGWRHTTHFARLSSASNAGLIAIGALLFLYQMHGYVHQVEAGSFPIGDDAHYHAHERLAEQSVVLPSASGPQPV